MLNHIRRVSKLLAAVLLLGTNSAFAAVTTVSMKSLSYEPKHIEIKAGDSVEWVNNSYTNHSATGDSGSDSGSDTKGASPGGPPSAQKASDSFDTGMVAPKAKSKKILFSEPGVYTYHCRMHGKTMSGQITVTP